MNDKINLVNNKLFNLGEMEAIGETHHEKHPRGNEAHRVQHKPSPVESISALSAPGVVGTVVLDRASAV